MNVKTTTLIALASICLLSQCDRTQTATDFKPDAQNTETEASNTNTSDAYEPSIEEQLRYKKAIANYQISETLLQEALSFCEQHNYNTHQFICINLGLHSGTERFFFVDFKTQEILNKGCVSHGCGSAPWSGTTTKEQASFSNTDGTHQSSLGKYAVTERGVSNWGVKVKYILKGLEATNSNAQKRLIVYHSWEEVSKEEVYPKGTPEGWGCPAVSNALFLELDPYLKTTSKPTLMWIINEPLSY